MYSEVVVLLDTDRTSEISMLALHWYCPACDVSRGSKETFSVETLPETSVFITEVFWLFVIVEPPTLINSMWGLTMTFSITVTVQVSETDCPASEIGADTTDITGGGNSNMI